MLFLTSHLSTLEQSVQTGRLGHLLLEASADCKALIFSLSWLSFPLCRPLAAASLSFSHRHGSSVCVGDGVHPGAPLFHLLRATAVPEAPLLSSPPPPLLLPLCRSCCPSTALICFRTSGGNTASCASSLILRERRSLLPLVEDLCP